ncbi:hypothetical protein [Glutamicibacter sp. TV12E]|uniref:hypothetical protein n=1 Tax=Glutamicibacter sp. TV12E TaxID=3446362 RepID=UPI00403346E9
MKSSENPYVSAVTKDMKRVEGMKVTQDTAAIGQLLCGVTNALLAVAHEVEGLRDDLKKGERSGS